MAAKRGEKWAIELINAQHGHSAKDLPTYASSHKRKVK